MDEMTIGEITRNLEKLTNEIRTYITSNEARIRTIEMTATELAVTNKNFKWFFGVVITVVNIASAVIIKII